MAKKTQYYFQHDCNAREDDKIVALRMEHGAAGYGVFFMLLEILSTSNDYRYERNYNKLGYILHERADLIKHVVEDYGLFQFADDGKLFYSVRLSQHMSDMLEHIQRMSDMGKRSAAKRSTGSTDVATQVQPTLNVGCNTGSTDVATQVQHIKLNNIKENNSSDVSRAHAREGSQFLNIEVLYDELKNELATETTTAENALRLYKVSREEILSLLDEFQARQRIEARDATTRHDYRNHFANWMNIQCKEKRKNKNDSNDRLHVSRTSTGYFTDF